MLKRMSLLVGLCFALLLVSVSSGVCRSLLNDTGQSTYAGQDVFAPDPGMEGQDADYGRDALARAGQLTKPLGSGMAGFAFTKVSDIRIDLPVSASSWTCVFDEHTNLLWEVKVHNGSSLHDFDWVYGWYNPDSSSNGGAAGNSAGGGGCLHSYPPDGIACTTEQFLADVNNATLCGLSDWRLPTVSELQGLATYNRGADPDADFFPTNASYTYWSATPAATDSSKAWSFDFATGLSQMEPKANSHAVRLVSEGYTR